MLVLPANLCTEMLRGLRGEDRTWWLFFNPFIALFSLFSFVFIFSRSTGLTCLAPTVPSSLQSMQSQPAKTCSGWCSRPSSLPCPTRTPAPTRMDITWPTGRACCRTTHWPGPGSSAPLATSDGARGRNRWGVWEFYITVTLPIDPTAHLTCLFLLFCTQLTPEEEEKRRVRRERNKLAAAKCRNRRRELTEMLQGVSITSSWSVRRLFAKTCDPGVLMKAWTPLLLLQPRRTGLTL